MADDSRLDKIEETLDAIHCAVVKMENGHGVKLDLLFEGQESLKADVADLKVGQREIRGEVREMKSSVGLLHAIANQHESRLQKVEGNLDDHLANNS